MSSLSLKTTFSSARNRAILANRFLLVSLFDLAEFKCVEQNRDVWAHPEIFELVSQTLLFLQIRVGVEYRRNTVVRGSRARKFFTKEANRALEPRSGP